MKYDTVTERNGFTKSLTTLNCGHARIKNVISTILPELNCIVCYKKTATLANLFLGSQFQLNLWALKLNHVKNVTPC